MPGEDKPQQQTHQRKKNKKSRSKGKNPSAHREGTLDGQDGLILPSVLQPPPKKLAEERKKVSVAKVEEESSIAICLQVLFPYLLAGMGMVFAGMVLDTVQVSTYSAEADFVNVASQIVVVSCYVLYCLAFACCWFTDLNIILSNSKSIVNAS